MEYLDYYDEYGNYIDSASREAVHEQGLWHKTVHCWLYDKAGDIYFQIRKDSHKLYTTASGHILSGETVKEGFAREVKEEIGVVVNVEKATMVEINVWKQDKVKNGKIFKDRAYANVYINLLDAEIPKFKFDENEVEGVIRVNAKKCLDLFLNKVKSINGIKYLEIGGEIKTIDSNVTLDDFLIFDNEIGILKYGKVLQAVIKETSL